MPEIPDFEQIARSVVPFCLGIKDSDDVQEACGLVAEQLRQVWNARGAADLSHVEIEAAKDEDDLVANASIRIQRAIKGLDR